jgi:hypothetical protein
LIQEANLEKSTAQIQLWVGINNARALHASSEDQVCRILSRNMKVLKEMTPARLSGSQSQQLALQALHSATAQSLAEFCLDHGRSPDPEFVSDPVAVIIQQGVCDYWRRIRADHRIHSHWC